MARVQAGDRISNYLLEQPIGSGSFGEVWRARHHVFGDLVAIKIPTDVEYVRNLQREGVAIHGLRHPNIVRAVDLDPYAEPPYLIMEYVEGPTLREAIDAARAEFPIHTAVQIMRGILRALTASHGAGVLHRDIKPANILIDHPLESLSMVTEHNVKITDFGLGRVGGVTAQSMVQSGSVLTDDGRSISGTLAYMSPEQKEGKTVDERTDLYSCGIVLFEMLTGERPQGGDSPSSLRSDVGADLDRVFHGSYTRHERRYPSAEAMLAALGSRHASPPPPHKTGSIGPVRSAPENEMSCPACHEPVQRHDQFCIKCGHQLVASVPKCPSCRGFVNRRDRFCIFCGTDLRILAT